MILAGDVGATKTILALAEPTGDADFAIVRERRFASGEHDGLEPVVREFLSEGEETVEAVSIGIACPIVEGVCEMTNLGWRVDRDSLRDGLGIDEVGLLNDLEATAYGIDALGPDQIETIHEGVERSGTSALLAPGSGLGAAILTHLDGRPLVLPTEGGHVDYAPRNPLEWELLEHLAEEHGRVSVERIVSGPGLHAIYRFLRDTGREEEPEWLAERLAASEDASATISGCALEGEAEICEAALRRFVASFGAAAGNLALATLALGGVYLGGGIAPKILPKLKEGPFVDAFLEKGRMADLLADVPVRVVLEPRTALLGAARHGLLHV
ncbi:MAG: glucokinase [Gemmatimonadota bacterium]|nr:glucokinase [Gemmatimonadota bacterium]